MHQDISLIINAIESLKQEPNIFKDYLFPIVSAFFTSLLGAWIAYFFFRYQENIKMEKEKIDVTNKWIILAEEAMTSLINFKTLYNNKLTAHPIQRALAVPTIIFTSSPIIEDYSKLSFLTTTVSNSDYPKWSQINRIRTMIHNYNYLQEIFQKRNDIGQPMKEKVLKKHSNKAFVNISNSDILTLVDHSELANFIHLTEYIINLIDDLLIEFEDFITNFPTYAKTLIKTKKLANYGGILTYLSTENIKTQELLKKSPDADYTSITNLFGKSEEELKQLFSTGY